MERIKYFNTPTQLMFVNPDAPKGHSPWSAGIGFRDSVIWSCCGKEFKIYEIHRKAKELNCSQSFYCYKCWIDLTNEIAGGVYPQGLEQSKNGKGIVETCCV